MKQRKLPLSASFPPMKKVPATEAPQFLLDHGFDAIDISIPSLLKQFESDWKEKTLEFKRVLDASDIIVESCHLPFHAASAEKLHEDLLVGIEMAGILGVKRGVIHPKGSNKAINTPENYEKWLKNNIEYYKQYIPLAEKAGFKIVTENMRNPLHSQGYHRFGSTAEEIIALADTLGLEICWDFGHANASGLDQYAELLKVGDRLTMTHINDNWAGEDDEHLPPFYGTTDWQAACRGLREIGYSHPINFEVKFKILPPQIIPKAADLVCAIGDLLLDMIFE